MQRNPQERLRKRAGAQVHTDGSAACLSLGKLGYRLGANGGQDDPVGGIATVPANARSGLSRPAKLGHPTPPAFGMNLDEQGRPECRLSGVFRPSTGVAAPALGTLKFTTKGF